ncbi:hypothetical protein D3OALGA1CA_1816 [Olavius algarvensis associated proteobacterium Delta 3]|nr:hypothetical protein D3OALGA1CA_1816 [Olavius algarvensis associated proteobacterium Delta 3]
MIDSLLPKIPSDRIAMHFYDTYGRDVPNVLASWSSGIRIFDASGGVSGAALSHRRRRAMSPPRHGSKHLKTRGKLSGVDLEKLSQARRLLDPFLVDERRSLPEDGSPAWAACEFSTSNVCCRR